MNYDEYLKLEEERLEINKRHLLNGVDFLDMKTAYIDKKTIIGKGTIIYPNVILDGNVVIGENCHIGQGSKIVNSRIGKETNIESSYIIDSVVGDKTSVGPFAYLRPNSNVGDNCKVGDFVEVKNSNLGNGSKASHLSYIGDSDIGQDVNIGCGVVFVNYDGSKKHRSIVKDGAFIGCNANIISPVTVEAGAYIAAGSTVTIDVPKGSLCVARAKARIIEGWVSRRGLLNKCK
ncbi:MAG: UDP-N-acetylglucosamine diphosphorylase [Peptostreptococcaceae bacterium]|nr:UDP-N-acetylglucosamine diphosphorylase [Peptostreptococcaceae bacterium]